MYGWRAKIAYMIPSSCTVFEQEFLAMTAGLEGVIGCLSMVSENVRLSGQRKCHLNCSQWYQVTPF